MSKLTNKKKSLLVIGLGRVGLPFALLLAKKGFSVFGFDHNQSLIDQLNQKKTPFLEPHVNQLLNRYLNKNFTPTSSLKELSEILHQVNAIFFNVGTQPLSEQEALEGALPGVSDYSNLLDQLMKEKKYFKKDLLLAFRTTFSLGTTDYLMRYLEKKHHLQEGKEIHVAFFPERVMVGEVIEEEDSLPKIIGTYSDHGFHLIQDILKEMQGDILRVKNPITAEFCKLSDNSFRSTMFAYANELAMHANQFNINIKEVIENVNKNYTRNHIPSPGFVSGYCLKKDPLLFEINFLQKKPNRNFQSLWFYGLKTNHYLQTYITQHILHQLDNPSNSTITILGLSFKENADDFRMSHAINMIEILIEAGVKKFKLYDPFLQSSQYAMIPSSFSSYITTRCDQLEPNLFSKAHAILICNPDQPLLELSSTQLNKLLINTHHPCYLFDIYTIWKNKIKTNHIKYWCLGDNH